MCALSQCICREESGNPEAIWQSDSRLSSGQMVCICAGERFTAGRIESDAGRPWRAEVLCDVCLSFVRMRVLQKGKGDMCEGEWTCVATDRRIGE